MKKTLTLTHIGRDSWDRQVYECGDKLYVDVNPRKGWVPEIRTKNGNEFDGEPLDPVADGTDIVFVPCRDTW